MSSPAIRELRHYPVKGMAGIAMERTRLTLQGIPGDRMYAFVRTDRVRPFPWLTLREYPAMNAWQPEWRPGEDGRDSVYVHGPAGDLFAVADPSFERAVAAAAGFPVRLHADYRGNPDVAPVSIISTATVEAICQFAGLRPDTRRFRMNLVVDGLPAFGEDAWVGSVLRVGSTRLAVVARDERCAVITVDPGGKGDREPLVLKATGELNRACAGVYAVVLQGGEVAVGDPVDAEA